MSSYLLASSVELRGCVEDDRGDRVASAVVPVPTGFFSWLQSDA